MTATKIQPVAEICSASHDDAQFGERAIKPLRDISGFEYGTPLYAGAAPAAVAGPAWDKTRDSLATLLLGLARRPFLDFDVACIALDAATEPGMPLAYMRGALAAPALEAPAAPATSAQVQALHRARRALHAIGKTYDDSELRTRALEADEEIDRMLAAAPQAPRLGEDALHLLRRQLSNQHTLTGPEFRAELEKIVAEESARHAAAPQAPADLQAAPVAWMYQRHGWSGGALFLPAGQEADDLRVGRSNIMAPCPNHYGWTALYAAPQAPAAPVGTDEVTCVYGATWERHGHCEYEMVHTPRKAAPAAPAVDARDTARMNWLEAQVVNVRAPLRYGSRDLFWASPEEVDGGPDGPSDLRARIDAAQAAAKGEHDD